MLGIRRHYPQRIETLPNYAVETQQNIITQPCYLQYLRDGGKKNSWHRSAVQFEEMFL